MKRYALLALFCLIAVLTFVLRQKEVVKQNDVSSAEEAVNPSASVQPQVQPAPAAPSDTVNVAPVEPGPAVSKAPKASAAVSKPKSIEQKPTLDILTEDEDREWRALLPTKSKTAAEVKAAPHDSPSSLRALAPSFAQLIEVSSRSPQEARKAFRKFEICARDSEGVYVTSLKVTCFANAQKIANKHPQELGSELEALQKNLDPQTLELSQTLNSL